MSFKIGDRVICKPGFTIEENSGGRGYKSGKVFVVNRITFNELNTKTILWASATEYGIYADACEYHKPNSHHGSVLKFNFIHK